MQWSATVGRPAARVAFPRSSPRLMLPLPPPPSNPGTYRRASMLLLPMSMTSTPLVCLLPLHMLCEPYLTVPQNGRPAICSTVPGKAGRPQYHRFTVTGVEAVRRGDAATARREAVEFTSRSADRPFQQRNFHGFPQSLA